ncbi:hypothetical protein AS029_09455 [Microbacterium enclense]|nr:hypothetical protein AS029_09455 [Microbacterium enclense]
MRVSPADSGCHDGTVEEEYRGYAAERPRLRTPAGRPSRDTCSLVDEGGAVHDTAAQVGEPVDATGTDDTGPFDELRDLRSGQ